jgi:hypothetical protein
LRRQVELGSEVVERIPTPGGRFHLTRHGPLELGDVVNIAQQGFEDGTSEAPQVGEFDA